MEAVVFVSAVLLVWLLVWAYRQRERARRRWVKYEIEHGRRPRGRTGPISRLEFDGPISAGDGVMGGFVATMHTRTLVQHFDKDGNEIVADRREILNKKFTTAARDAVVDAFTGAFTLSNFNYHDAGTGTTAEANSQTALVTPWGGARVSGTQSQPTADVYQTVATISFNNTFAITEHGVFSASTVGTLLDRTLFTAINVVSGDSITFTFQLTIAAEA